MVTPIELEFSVASYLRGRRIDSVLARHLRNHTPFRVQRLVRAGLVQLDRQVVDLKTRVYPGQRVRVRVVEPPDKLLTATALPVEILYEDEWLTVVNKPPGQMTHPAAEPRADTLINALQWHLDHQETPRGLLRPGIVHRLDRDTSGVIVTTKHHLAHRNLSIQFQQREVTKTYLALVEGRIRNHTGVIVRDIGHVDDPESILMSAETNARDARSARTDYRVIERFDDSTWLEASPQTGRLHQIRVHLAHIGHPVLGDPFYGPCGQIRQDKQGRPLVPVGTCLAEPSLTRQALHASRLECRHPIDERPMQFEAPLPEDLAQAVGIAKRGCSDRIDSPG